MAASVRSRMPATVGSLGSWLVLAWYMLFICQVVAWHSLGALQDICLAFAEHSLGNFLEAAFSEGPSPPGGEAAEPPWGEAVGDA